MGRITFLDGFRGVAILLVVLFHMNILEFGFAGVELFFIISGFITTSSILSKQKDTGEYSVLSFLQRRLSRIGIPFLGFILITLLIFINFPTLSIQDTVYSQAFFSSISLSNWFEIVHSNGYWEQGVKSPLLHLWYISMLLQFHLILALVMKLFLKKGTAVLNNQKLSFTLAALFILTTLATYFLSMTHSFGFLYYNTLTRAPSFLLGSLVGSLLIGYPPRKSESKKIASLTIILFLLVVFVTTQFKLNSIYLFRGGITVYSLLFCGLLYLLLKQRPKIISALVENEIFLFWGKISFSLYLIHMPVLTFMSNQTILTIFKMNLDNYEWLVRIVQFCLSICLAWLFWYFIEKRLFLNNWKTLILFLTVFVGAIFALTHGYDYKVKFINFSTNIESKWMGSAPIVMEGNVGLLFVGDSWSKRTAMGVSLAQEEINSTEFQILAYGFGNGSIMNPDYFIQNGNQNVPFMNFDNYFAYWQTAITNYSPTKVILQFGNADQAEMVIDGKKKRIGNPDFDKHFIEQYQLVIDFFVSKNIEVYILNVINNAHSNNDLELNQQSDAMNKNIETVVKNNKGTIHFINLNSKLSFGSSNLSPKSNKGIIFYDETGHTSYEGSLFIGRWLLEKVE